MAVSLLLTIAVYLAGAFMIVSAVRSRAHRSEPLSGPKRALAAASGVVIVLSVILIQWGADSTPSADGYSGFGALLVAVVVLACWACGRGTLRVGRTLYQRSRPGAVIVSISLVVAYVLVPLAFFGLLVVSVRSSGVGDLYSSSATPTTAGTGIGPATAGSGSSSGSSVGGGGGDDDQYGSDPQAYERLRQAQQAALRSGVVVYRPPSPMRVGSTQIVVVRAADLANRAVAREGLGDQGQLRVRSMPVGFALDADLSGDGFEVVRIDGRSSGLRPLGSGDVADWRWLVKPSASGGKKLTLTVQVVAGATGPVSIRYFDEDVEVTPDWWYSTRQFLKTYWGSTGLTVPVLLGALYGGSRLLRRQGPRSGLVEDGTSSVACTRARTDASSEAHSTESSAGADDRRGYL